MRSTSNNYVNAQGHLNSVPQNTVSTNNATYPSNPTNNVFVTTQHQTTNMNTEHQCPLATQKQGKLFFD